MGRHARLNSALESKRRKEISDNNTAVPLYFRSIYRQGTDAHTRRGLFVTCSECVSSRACICLANQSKWIGSLGRPPIAPSRRNCPASKHHPSTADKKDTCGSLAIQYSIYKFNLVSKYNTRSKYRDIRTRVKRRVRGHVGSATTIMGSRQRQAASARCRGRKI